MPTDRIRGSAAEDEAHELAARWLEQAGLVVEVDVDGNLFGRSRESDDVWVGSHLDTVPAGGRFDGALGVVAAIEAVEQTGSGSVVAFRGEEVGCIGSRALVARGDPLPRVPRASRRAGPGARPARHPAERGTGIRRYGRGELVLSKDVPATRGRPNEGPRRRAGCRRGGTILRIRDAALVIEDAVATVGNVDVEPGGANVILDRVWMSLDVRAPDRARLDQMIAAIGFEPAYRVSRWTG